MPRKSFNDATEEMEARPEMERVSTDYDQNAIPDVMPGDDIQGHGRRDEEWHSSNKDDDESSATNLNTVDAAGLELSNLDNSYEPTDEVTYPEGGLRAWSLVAGSFCGMCVTFGYQNTIGIYQAYLSTHQLAPYSASSIGWIFSIHIFLCLSCGLPIGPIFDAKGPRFLILTGAILLSLSIMLLGICTQYWHFLLVFGVLGGIGSAFIFTPAISAVGHFFYAKRANATGIACLGGSVGGLVFPLLLQSLFAKLGWAWATRIQGFIFILLHIFACLLIRSRLPPRPRSSVRPDIRILREPAFLTVTIGTFFLDWGYYIPITYLASSALASGAMNEAFAFKLLAIFNAASCVGRWLPGRLADSLGRYNTMIVTIFLCMISSLGLWLPTTLLATNGKAEVSTIWNLTLAYAVIMGFGSGSNISLTPVCVGMLCDTNEYGRYYATCYTIVSVGTLTGVPLVGSVIAASGGSYWGVALFTGLCYAFALTCFTTVRLMKTGLRLKVYY